MALNRRTAQRDGLEGTAQMGRQDGGGYPVHRTRLTVENRYCESFNGKLRDESARARDLLLAQGGENRDRSMRTHTIASDRIRRWLSGRPRPSATRYLAFRLPMAAAMP